MRRGGLSTLCESLGQSVPHTLAVSKNQPNPWRFGLREPNFSGLDFLPNNRAPSQKNTVQRFIGFWGIGHTGHFGKSDISQQVLPCVLRNPGVCSPQIGISIEPPPLE